MRKGFRRQSFPAGLSADASLCLCERKPGQGLLTAVEEARLLLSIRASPGACGGDPSSRRPQTFLGFWALRGDSSVKSLHQAWLRDLRWSLLSSPQSPWGKKKKAFGLEKNGAIVPASLRAGGQRGLVREQGLGPLSPLDISFPLKETRSFYLKGLPCGHELLVL